MFQAYSISVARVLPLQDLIKKKKEYPKNAKAKGTVSKYFGPCACSCLYAYPCVKHALTLFSLVQALHLRSCVVLLVKSTNNLALIVPY